MYLLGSPQQQAQRVSGEEAAQVLGAHPEGYTTGSWMSRAEGNQTLTVYYLRPQVSRICVTRTWIPFIRLNGNTWKTHRTTEWKSKISMRCSRKLFSIFSGSGLAHPVSLDIPLSLSTHVHSLRDLCAYMHNGAHSYTSTHVFIHTYTSVTWDHRKRAFL